MLVVPNSVLLSSFSHARAETPREAVGVWLGKGLVVQRAEPLPNRSSQPLVAYDADPVHLIQVLRNSRAEGLELVAIYHSHPQGAAWPSRTDRELAYWRVPYVILGLAEGRARAFMLPEAGEVEILVESS